MLRCVRSAATYFEWYEFKVNTVCVCRTFKLYEYSPCRTVNSTSNFGLCAAYFKGINANI
jgi:hypothetical protein